MAGQQLRSLVKGSGELSLAEALALDKIARYGPRNTGGKYLVNPQKGWGR